MDLRNLRKEYVQGEINDFIIPDEPISWFEEWFREASQSGEPEPSAMVLSTVSGDLKPSSRIVLLKEVDKRGFVFFTNYNSRKGLQIIRNNNVALNFFWPLTERQVRVEGVVEKVSDADSDFYFLSRPVESRINAIISPQSEKISSRQELELKRDKILYETDTENLLRPSHWGGYRLKPELVEFWQGRPGRLHDRIQYLLKDNEWIISRLAP